MRLRAEVTPRRREREPLPASLADARGERAAIQADLAALDRRYRAGTLMEDDLSEVARRYRVELIPW